MESSAKEKESSKQNSSGSMSEEELSPSESRTSPTPEAPAGQGSESEERTVEVEAAKGAIDFNHPLLKGKTPEEIERIVAQQEETIRDQGRELNQYFDRTRQQEQAKARPSHQEEPEEDPYGDSVLADNFRRLEQRVNKRLEEAVAPLRESVKEGRAMTARERLRGELKYFERLEPHIDRLLRERNVSPSQANEDLLRTMYFAARGFAADQGINLDSPEGGAQPSREQPREQPAGQGGERPVNIPQHRPSSSPMPSRPSDEQKKRPLTEEERKMAQHYGMSEDEYREWSNKPRDEIVSPGYSKEGW